MLLEGGIELDGECKRENRTLCLAQSTNSCKSVSFV